MDNIRYVAEVSDLQRRNRVLGLCIGALLAILALALTLVYQSLINTRTIVVPPNLQRQFWVEAERAQQPYLEQMAGFVAWLCLDVTPASIDWKRNALLGYVDPADEPQVRKMFEASAERLKKLNGGTYFQPREVAVDEVHQLVRIEGVLHTLVNGQQTSARPARYVLRFGFHNGRFHLKSFEEESE